MCRQRTPDSVRPVLAGKCPLDSPGGAARGQYLCRVRARKTAGFPDNRHFMFHRLFASGLPLYAADFRVYRRHEHYPVFRAVLGRDSECVSDSAGIAHAGAVLYGLCAGAPTVGRQCHRAENYRRPDGAFQSVGDYRHFGRRQFLRGGGYVFRGAGVRVSAVRGGLRDTSAPRRAQPSHGFNGLRESQP